jgi:uncharacterized protein with ParB-like and HNH nuclease domain
MENQLYSISKIFTERILRIPDYQRGYAWTDKQLKDFWSDLIQLEDGKNHYTGVLTLEDVPEITVNRWEDDIWIIKSKNYSPYYVVDGQQRLTTSIILIQCIIECVPANQRLNYTLVDEIRKKFIYDSKDDGISRSYLFGYEKDNSSYEFLKTRIFLEGSDVSFPKQETIYTHNLERAKTFFLERLKELTFAQIENLYSKLTQNFHFNLYSISSDIDVYVAFETMNNRGKPLSHLELLKNRLIYLSTKFNADDFERQRLRNAINEGWKSIYHYLGKNKDNPLDDDIFLYNHFVIYHGDKLDEIRKKYGQPLTRYRRGPQSVYQDYLLEEKFTAKTLTDNTVNLQEVYSYVQSLKNSVEIWYKLLNPADSDFSQEEKIWLDKLNRIGILQAAPLMLVVYQKEKDEKIRTRFLKSIERYLFFYTFPETPLLYSVLLLNERIHFLQLSTQLSTGQSQTEKIIRDVEQATDNFVGTPNVIQHIIAQFRSKGFYNWRGIKYFLYEYELELKGKSKTYRDKINWEEFSKEDSRDFYTVEHIYPQKARKSCWVDTFSHYSEKERYALKHSLGNLVPLSQPKNSSFQNKCFDDKKGSLDTQVGFRFGSYSENEVSAYEKWTAREILERGLKLLTFMEKRWKINFGDQKDRIRLLNLDAVPKKEGIKIS